jgi:alkanesulfonate monooxygenase SsuD/methylene tetrahydromethanopterin reductase-like flavin-dependent oxidoreductase (luciferase family)
MRIGLKAGQWGWPFADLLEFWRSAEASGFDIISCFDHVTAAPSGLAAWEPTALLGIMAGQTRRVALTVDVLNSCLRNPFLLAAQLAVVQAASGRLEVGLGAGSYHLARFDHESLGIPFPRLEARRARLAVCCRVLPALWRGETVTVPELGLHSASLGPIAIAPPPVIVGGRSRASLELAAQYADGWNTVISTADEAVRWMVAARDVADNLRRARPLPVNVQIFLRDLELHEVPALVERVQSAGIHTLTFVLVEERDPDIVIKLSRLVHRAREAV